MGTPMNTRTIIMVITMLTIISTSIMLIMNRMIMYMSMPRPETCTSATVPPVYRCPA